MRRKTAFFSKASAAVAAVTFILSASSIAYAEETSEAENALLVTTDKISFLDDDVLASIDGKAKQYADSTNTTSKKETTTKKTESTETKTSTSSVKTSTQNQTASDAVEEPTELEQYFEDKGVLNVEKAGILNIREKLGADQEAVGYLYEDGLVTILGEKNGWLKVESGNVEGWVNADYILTGEEAAEYYEDKVEAFGVVLSDTLNLRAEESKNGEILDVVSKNETLELVETDGDWYKVIDERGITGYVSNDYVEISYGFSTAKTVEEVAEEERIAQEKLEAEIKAEEERIAQVEAEKKRIAEIEAEEKRIAEIEAEEKRIAEIEAEEKRQQEIAAAEEKRQQEIAAAEEKRQQEIAAAEAAAQEAAAKAAAQAAAAPVTVSEQTTQAQESQSALQLLGTYKITYYCACEVCTGRANAHTATGTVPVAGRTVAVNPSQIALGSVLVINGQEYIAEDCGVSAGIVDIFVNDHNYALQLGVGYCDVYLKN